MKGELNARTLEKQSTKEKGSLISYPRSAIMDFYLNENRKLKK